MTQRLLKPLPLVVMDQTPTTQVDPKDLNQVTQAPPDSPPLGLMDLSLTLQAG